MIQFSCSCGKAMQVKDELAGKRVRCPECSSVVSVPGGAAAPVAARSGAAGSRRKREPAAAPSTMPCAHCHRQIPVDIPNCPNCGSMTLQSMFHAPPTGRKHAFPWQKYLTQIIWLTVIVVGGYFAWKHGGELVQWAQVQGAWGEISKAFDSDPNLGDSRVIAYLDNAIEMGPEIDPLLLEKYASAANDVVRQRVLFLQAVLATQREVSDENVQLMQRGVDNVRPDARDWGLYGLALAAGGPEEVHAVLRCFRGKGKFEIQRVGDNRLAASVLKAVEPVDDVEFDSALAAAKVLAGDTQAMPAFFDLLDRATSQERGRLKELLSRLTGRRFADSASMKAWWEGDEGAYKEPRPQWLIDALQEEESSEHLGIIQQLRALSGENFNYNRAASESVKADCVRSWRNWWIAAKERGRW